MTRDEIAKVQASWRSAAPVKYVAAELFYVKLFELDPTLKLLFGDHPKMRQRKFLQLMDATVNGLERTDVLMPAIRECRTCHAGANSKDKLPSGCLMCHQFHLPGRGLFDELSTLESQSSSRAGIIRRMREQQP